MVRELLEDLLDKALTQRKARRQTKRSECPQRQVDPRDYRRSPCLTRTPAFGASSAVLQCPFTVVGRSPEAGTGRLPPFRASRSGLAVILSGITMLRRWQPARAAGAKPAWPASIVLPHRSFAPRRSPRSAAVPASAALRQAGGFVLFSRVSPAHGLHFMHRPARGSALRATTGSFSSCNISYPIAAASYDPV